MQLEQITMDRNEARKAFLEYRASVREQHDPEDEQIMQGYRAGGLGLDGVGAGRVGNTSVTHDIDEILYRLRVHGLPYKWDETDLGLWRAVCPACWAPSWSLMIRRPRLTCTVGCPQDLILEALLRAPVADLLEAADLRLERALRAASRAVSVAREALELVG